jgi:hypothetical protein
MSEEKINELPLPGANAASLFGWHSKRMIMPDKPPRPRKIPDRSVKKRKKQYERMTYAPEGGVYAINIIFVPGYNVQYLLVQNINTRYVRAYKLPDRTKAELQKALNHLIKEQIIHEGKPFNRLVGDAEKGWANNDIRKWLREHRIHADFKVGNHIRHIPILDATIKTLRKGCNGDNEFLADVGCFSQLLNLFNHSVVKTTKLTPIEMEVYPELEESWICHCKRHNREVELRYSLNYKKGNILLVHFNQSKTHRKFVKQSTGRQYSYFCEFVDYHGKNLAVKRLDENSEPRMAVTGKVDGRSRPRIYLIPFYDAIYFAEDKEHALEKLDMPAQKQLSQRSVN